MSMHHLAFMLQVVVSRPNLVGREICLAFCAKLLLGCLASCVCVLSPACKRMRTSWKSSQYRAIANNICEELRLRERSLLKSDPARSMPQLLRFCNFVCVCMCAVLRQQV